MKKFVISAISFLMIFSFFSCEQEVEKTEIEVKTAALEIGSLPAKLNYLKNEKTDYSGLTVNMVYTDGSRKKLAENEYSITPSAKTLLSEEGSQAVKISADGKTAFFTISVRNPAETYSSSLEISSLPDKLSYFINGTLELKGLVVKMNKTDGTSKVLAESEYTVEPAEGSVLSEDGNQAVKISADGKTAFFSVYVGKTVYTNLRLKSMPVKTYYKDNEMFDTTGMEVVAAFDDGSERTLEAWEYKTNLQNGSGLKAGSGQKVAITYCGKEVSFYINVGSTWETYTFVDDYENNDANSVGVKNHTITDICRGNTNLKTIVIPDSIETIERYAFKGCTALEEVEFPDGIKIEKEAFNGCKSLKSIKFKGGVEFEAGAFKDCENISGELVFPTAVSFPYGYDVFAFENCNNITSVVFSGDDKWLFYCRGNNAFKNCISLESVVFNKDYSYSELHFEDCTALKNVENMEGWCAVFKNCTSLENIKISDTVTKIPADAFYGCSSLQNIDIPNSVIEIGERAFTNCSKLTTIQIPYKVEEIWLDSFYGCENLQEIKLCSGNLSTIDIYDGSISRKSVVEYLKEKNIKISYDGTKSQFNEIKIGYYDDLRESLNGITIYCSDGSFVYGEE